MKNASCFKFLYVLYQKCYNFSKWKVVKSSTRSLDSPYTEHGYPHFHKEYRLNRSPHEYIH